MDDRGNVPVNDRALDREIEAALAIDPSPAFVARLRARVASEVGPASWRVRWELAAAGVALAIVVVVAAIFRFDQIPTPGGEEGINPATTLVRESPPLITPRSEPSGGALTGSRPQRGGRDDSGLPEVVVAPDESATLRSFMDMVSDGRFDASLLADAVPGTTALDAPGQIDIEPIVIPPLAALAPIAMEGERQ
jgi:hypothetical protein